MTIYHAKGQFPFSKDRAETSPESLSFLWCWGNLTFTPSPDQKEKKRNNSNNNDNNNNNNNNSNGNNNNNKNPRTYILVTWRVSSIPEFFVWGLLQWRINVISYGNPDVLGLQPCRMDGEMWWTMCSNTPQRPTTWTTDPILTCGFLGIFFNWVVSTTC